MPILHAALKQMRKDRKRHARNQAIRSELKTTTKQFLTSLKQNNPSEAAALMRTVAKKLDRAASKKMIHRKTASRYKSRLTQRLNRALPAKA